MLDKLVWVLELVCLCELMHQLEADRLFARICFDLVNDCLVAECELESIRDFVVDILRNVFVSLLSNLGVRIAGLYGDLSIIIKFLVRFR